MTILERIRGEQRRGQIGRIARDLMNRDLSALGRDAADLLDDVKEIPAAAGDAIEHLQGLAVGAVERAGDAVGQAGDQATKAGRDLRLEKLDGRVDDIVDRLRKTMPADRITHLVTNLERELPTTDKDRYDRAYSRGWARARTSYVGIGILTGVLAGIAGLFLLDPQRGRQRREALVARVRSATSGVSNTLRQRTSATADRVRSRVADRSSGTHEAHADAAVMQATPFAGSMVAVMDPDASGGLTGPDLNGDVEPVMPVGDGPVTDASSIEREPLTAPEGGFIGGTSSAEPASPESASDVDPQGGTADDALLPANSSAVTSTLEPEAEDATITGDDAGTFHRTL